MQRVYIIGMQIIYLPLGITLARLFHCTDTGKLDVDNTVTCWEVTKLHIGKIFLGNTFITFK